MIRLLLSFIFILTFWAGPACATNITAQGSRDGSEDRIQVLRGLAEVMIKESQEHAGVKEGEELVVRPGGKTGNTETDATAEQRQWQAGLVRMGDSIQLDELPSLIQGLRRSQGDTFGALQNQFKSLSAADTVTADEQQTFLKNIERLTGTMLDDQAILSCLQLKVETALTTASPAARSQLLGELKMISDERAALQLFQANSAKMAKAQFKTGAAVESTVVAAAQTEVASTWADVDGLLKAVEGNPAGLSQDFFSDGQDKLNGSLKELSDLQVRVQAALDQDPADRAAQSLLKQISAYVTQISSTLRDFAVVRINSSVITQIQDLNDSLGRDAKYLRETVASLQAAGLTKEQLDLLFAHYDEMLARYAEGQKLYASVERSAGGQKYKTAEQVELESLWAQVSETFQKLGAAGDSLGSPDRDKLWAAYLKPAPLALINDVTAATLQGQPIVAKYLPVTPPAAHSDVSAALSGKLLGDVLVKDGITYGVTVNILGPTELSGPGDTASIKKAQLEVFRIENGNYTSRTLEVFDIYPDVPHAALSIDGSGVLSVFLNNTLGDKNMQGVLYKMDTATLTTAPNPHLFAFGVNQGWYPYIDEEGKVQNLYINGSGVLAVCADNAPCAASLIPGLDFVRWTDALKAAHSNFTFNTAAAPSELPTDVVAKRLTGETGVTGLGNYDYMSWGKWNDGAGVVDTIYTNSSWIAGDLTPAADIPITGSASYKGQVVGKQTDGVTISNIGGTTALTANFSDKTLAGTFDMTKNNAAWKTANVNASWGAGTGNIAGTLATTDATMTGAVNGNFFGPHVDSAKHVGGAWNLSNTAGTDKAAGVFTGNKQ